MLLLAYYCLHTIACKRDVAHCCLYWCVCILLLVSVMWLMFACAGILNCLLQADSGEWPLGSVEELATALAAPRTLFQDMAMEVYLLLYSVVFTTILQ
jgi:hypothetical protein